MLKESLVYKAMYSYEFTPSALRDLEKFSKPIQKRILIKLDFFVSCSNPLLFAHHLINSDIGQYRFRISDYRVVFDVDDQVMTILAVGHRKDIYR